MADLPDTDVQTKVRPHRGSTPSTPRWVKVFGILALVLVLLFVILHLTGNNPGGPGRHGDAGDPDSVTLVTAPLIEQLSPVLQKQPLLLSSTFYGSSPAVFSYL